MYFRERDGVCVTYEVRGYPGSEQYPYVNDLPTLRAAIEIAKSYPVQQNGSRTDIVRQYAKLLPPGSEYHHRSGPTHRWRVEANGGLLLVVVFSRNWPTTRIGMDQYGKSISKPRTVATCLKGQLWDLAMIADNIGMKEAHDELLALIYPNRRRHHPIDDKQIIQQKKVPWWNIASRLGL